MREKGRSGWWKPLVRRLASLPPLWGKDRMGGRADLSLWASQRAKPSKLGATPLPSLPHKGGGGPKPPTGPAARLQGERGGWLTSARRFTLPVGVTLSLAALALISADSAWTRYTASLAPLDLAASREGSTLVVDRDGRLLRPFTLPDGRWRLKATTHDVDPRYVAMLIAYEDGRFYDHHGVDARALLRAAGQWLARGRIVSGGSTLSMQVARLIEPRPERNVAAKLRQIARAEEIERAVGKAGVLDRYLTMAPFGGNLEGARAASLAYFGKEPLKLTVAEAALLVALPQSPEARRPDRFPAAARAARDRVLDRVAARGTVSAEDAAAAKREPVPEARRPFPALAAHATEEAVAADPGAKVIRLSIDARLQAKLEALVKESVARLGARLSAAIVVIDNRSGEIRARVGAADRDDASRGGAIDMSRVPRSPGSALKPFIYALAFEEGLAHPETVLFDRPARYGAYAPENFDLGYQGTVTARKALQMSLNLPAIEVLADVGPATFLARLHGAGAEVALPKDTPIGLAIGLGGLGDLAHGRRAPLRGSCTRWRSAGIDRAPGRRRSDHRPSARHRSGRGLVRRRYPARRAAAGQLALGPHRLQDRHVLRFSRRAGGRLRQGNDDRRLGRSAGQRPDAGPDRPRGRGADSVRRLRAPRPRGRNHQAAQGRARRRAHRRPAAAAPAPAQGRAQDDGRDGDGGAQDRLSAGRGADRPRA